VGQEERGDEGFKGFERRLTRRYRLYAVTAGGAALSITLAGYRTVALAGGASAAAVQAALQNLLFPGESCGTANFRHNDRSTSTVELLK
jgi:transcription elongation factor